MIYRTARTGSVQSPCYNGTVAYYPEELTGGRKLINITHRSPYIVGKKKISRVRVGCHSCKFFLYVGQQYMSLA